MSQRRHHPVNKNGGKGEEREEVEGKQKKKKLRKVGLEVELKRHKRINQTCVCGGCFPLFCKSVSVQDRAVSSQQLAPDMHRYIYFYFFILFFYWYIPMELQLLPVEV